MSTLICSLPLTSSWRGLQVEDTEQKNARRVVLTVCSVLISEVQRDSLRHRRPSCFTADPARTPQNWSFVEAPHPLLQVRLTILTHFHILYPLFLAVVVERSSWQFRTRQATHPRMRVIVIVTICSDARFPWSTVSPTKSMHRFITSWCDTRYWILW